MIWRGLAAFVAFAILMMSCTESTEPVPDPTPGWLALRLWTPNTDDGGIIFTVSGASIDSVRSTYPDAFMTRTGSNAWRMLVAGDLIGGAVVAEVHVPDIAKASSYTGTIEQVAARAPSFAQRSLSEYALTVTTP